MTDLIVVPQTNQLAETQGTGAGQRLRLLDILPLLVKLLKTGTPALPDFPSAAADVLPSS
jgi:hypothetical protein